MQAPHRIGKGAFTECAENLVLLSVGADVTSGGRAAVRGADLPEQGSYWTTSGTTGEGPSDNGIWYRCVRYEAMLWNNGAAE